MSSTKQETYRSGNGFYFLPFPYRRWGDELWARSPEVINNKHWSSQPYAGKGKAGERNNKKKTNAMATEDSLQSCELGAAAATVAAAAVLVLSHWTGTDIR